MPLLSQAATATVIIPTFTLGRWGMLGDAVASVEAQTVSPIELIICIDHNQELLERCTERWGKHVSAAGFPVHVVANKFEQDDAGARAHVKAHGSRRRFGAGWARNSGAQDARGDILVFMDDDAAAEADWLARLLAPYQDPWTIAVGGAPLPAFETERPPWFPVNFDWVFGCSYEGLPKELAQVSHLIGANMSVRREVFEGIGGFHSIDFDDLDLCMRIAAYRPGYHLLYEPRAVVHHYVPAERVTWHYFWRRCFFVNCEKVAAFADMGKAANLRAERQFVSRAITLQAFAEITDALSGRGSALLRLGAIAIGVAMAGAGHVVGRIRLLWARVALGRPIRV
jgi:cellulose synthase/poly-beta-1,6-N-acetylglucosamine synthase-like glycosyltransferase